MQWGAILLQQARSFRRVSLRYNAMTRPVKQLSGGRSGMNSIPEQSRPSAGTTSDDIDAMARALEAMTEIQVHPTPILEPVVQEENSPEMSGDLGVFSEVNEADEEIKGRVPFSLDGAAEDDEQVLAWDEQDVRIGPVPFTGEAATEPAGPGQVAMDSVRVRILAADRREVIRKRSWAIIGLVLAIAGAVKCGLHLGQELEISSNWMAIGIWGAGVGIAVACMFTCLIWTSRLGKQITPVKWPDPTESPDFTGLSDGSELHKALEQVRD